MSEEMEAPLGTVEMPVKHGPDWKAVAIGIEHILNRESIDNEIGIPDFILANYLVDQLRVLKSINRASELWHGPGICVKPHSGERNQDKHVPDGKECKALDPVVKCAYCNDSCLEETGVPCTYCTSIIE